MRTRRYLRVTTALLVVGMLTGLTGGVASAKRMNKPAKHRPAHTKMMFRLADHHVMLGEEVTGSVRLLSGKGRHRKPLEGATLIVKVDGVEVGTLTTGADGKAAVSHLAEAEGEHVMKILYAGDKDHRRSKRAQGFEVGAAEEETEETEEEIPVEEGAEAAI